MRFKEGLFDRPVLVESNLLVVEGPVDRLPGNQEQTERVFSEKWSQTDRLEEVEKLFKFQQEWFLSLYGFESEDSLAEFLRGKPVIIDAGCGLGYKAAWFARLAPDSLVVGLDISESTAIAAEHFKDIPNLYFHRCDIAHTPFSARSVDFVVCDQVIHHTEKPEETFAHLSSLLTEEGQFACYVYRKKALPRELIDEHFRFRTHQVPDEEMWEFSSQLTELGRRLSALGAEFDCPDIPLLGIKGGRMDVQRFLYWNFLKCFWKEDWGFDLSRTVNYDWYAPSNAYRYSREEYEKLVHQNGLVIACFHEEEACYSGRFQRASKDLTR